jgi:putative membrane protein
VTGLDAFIPHLKAMHIGLLALWIAGLFSLANMLARHKGTRTPAEFAQIRRATHYAYVWAITPAAVLTIATGTLLIFVREVFAAWILAKLVLVAGLVALHAWAGHTIILVAETDGTHRPPGALVPSLAILGLVIAILMLVLSKPELEEAWVPAWLKSPLGRQLPFDVPSR